MREIFTYHSGKLTGNNAGTVLNLRGMTVRSAPHWQMQLSLR